MEEKIRAAVEEVIREKIEPGCFFDSHSVIWYVKENNECNYHQYIESLSDNDFTANGRIGLMIAKLGLAEKQEGVESWSMNTRKRFSKCALWKKL